MTTAASHRFVYLVPAHNEERVLRATVEKLVGFLGGFPGSSILILENGSTDSTWEIARSLAGERGGVSVRAFHSDAAGLGTAYRQGVREALAEEPGWVVFSAADLPFETSDVENFLAARAEDPRTLVATGSKLHADSEIHRSPARELMSRMYSICRKMLLGMRTRDCQGSVIIHSGLLRGAAGMVRADNYFYTTELIYVVERAGLAVREVPVRFLGEKRPSTIHPLRHGSQMLWQIVQLAARDARVSASRSAPAGI